MEGENDFMNPIDPGLFFDPTTGKLWVVYGSYFGYLRIVELNPNNANAWNQLGIALIRTGQGERGQEAFDKVLELQGNTP